jgi:hypothetical protein
MTSKSIVFEWNEDEKLDGKNYDIWYKKVRYFLNKKEVLRDLDQ